jgi:hypothetical protein
MEYSIKTEPLTTTDIKKMKNAIGDYRVTILLVIVLIAATFVIMTFAKTDDGTKVPIWLMLVMGLIAANIFWGSVKTLLDGLRDLASNEKVVIIGFCTLYRHDVGGVEDFDVIIENYGKINLAGFNRSNYGLRFTSDGFYEIHLSEFSKTILFLEKK